MTRRVCMRCNSSWTIAEVPQRGMPRIIPAMQAGSGLRSGVRCCAAVLSGPHLSSQRLQVCVAHPIDARKSCCACMKQVVVRTRCIDEQPPSHEKHRQSSETCLVTHAHNLAMFSSLLQREAGSGTPRKQGSVRSACSIALALRLERIGTLDGHDGCVNTVVCAHPQAPRLLSACTCCTLAQHGTSPGRQSAA